MGEFEKGIKEGKDKNTNSKAKTGGKSGYETVQDTPHNPAGPGFAGCDTLDASIASR